MQVDKVNDNKTMTPPWDGYVHIAMLVSGQNSAAGKYVVSSVTTVTLTRA